jgi:polysaccharide deacetylase family sporulation protein PdaB
MMKIFLALSAALICIAVVSITFFDIGAFGQEKKLPIYSVGTEEKKVAISFDAAWGNDHTLPILNILDHYGVKTTYFLVKFWAEKYPEDVKAIKARGHEVENHSSTHPKMTTLSVEQMKAELEGASATIESLTGVRPRLFRPPFGDYNNSVIETVENAGYKVIQWSVDSLDWKELSADEIVERVLKRVEPGSIVLFHNHATHVEEYLPQILEGLQAEGYEVVPIGELIYWDNYHIDNTGKQILE